MATNRGTYRFRYIGNNTFESWLDDRFGDVCGLGLTGVLLGDEDQGFIVVEGEQSDIDAIKADIKSDPDIDSFLTLLEETDVTSRYTEFAEFVESGAKDRC
ncbi:MAG: hypothetical protein ACQEVA_12405 [Myxococcota bacterium]